MTSQLPIGLQLGRLRVLTGNPRACEWFPSVSPLARYPLKTAYILYILPIPDKLVGNYYMPKKPIVLILSYPLLIHLGVWLEQSIIQVFALLILALGLLLPGLRQGRHLIWALFSLTLLLVGLLAYMNTAIYLVYLLPVAIPLFCWAAFFHSLLPGQTPMVTAIGEQARGPLSGQMRSYTRGVTVLWAVVLAAMALWSALLLWLASPALWSLFTNFINYIVLAVLFMAEFVYRKWRFRDHDHPGLTEYLKIVAAADIGKR